MVRDPERFDRLFSRAFVSLSAIVVTVLAKTRGMDWPVAVTTGVTVAVVVHLALRLTGGPSSYMGGGDGVPAGMPPPRTLVLLGAGMACSLVAWAAEGPVAAVFSVLALLAAAGLFVTRPRR